MEFLRNLEFLLAKHNMSRAELARNIGIAPSTVNAWFNKSCEGVSLKTLKDIASYFNVTLEELVNSDGISSLYFTEDEYSKEELQMISRFGRFLKESRNG